MMRLPKFDYRTPRTISEAVKIIGDTGPDAQFVAGGTDLYPNMKRRQQMPRTVISVMRLSELNKIDGDGKGGLRIGASFRLVSTLGERMIDASGFYNDDGIDYLKKRPDELLVDIHLPPTNGWRASYQKLRRRGAFDFPVLGVAAWVRTGSGGDRVTDAKIVLGAVAPSPVQVREAEQVLIDQPFDEEHIQAAAEACYIKARPLDNTDFVMNWRKQMTREYTLRALHELV